MATASTMVTCPHCGCAVECRRGRACAVTFHHAEFRDLCCEEGDGTPLDCPTLTDLISALACGDDRAVSRTKARSPRRSPA